METFCSSPGCTQLGTSFCGACKTAIYCSINCQTSFWIYHKEECQGHLRKVGTAHLDKAKGFHREQQNWVQALRYAELASTKLKQLKDRSLETVKLIDKALGCKFDSLQHLGRHREAKDCAEERYTLWAMNQMRNSGSIYAALGLIESCLHNGEYEDAKRYADHAMFMINDMADNFISSDKRPSLLADGSHYLALATLALARAGGIPSGEKQQLGEEAIASARQALAMHTQLFGTENAQVALDLCTLADVLEYFNNVDDDEVPRLMEQAIATYSRVEGGSSYNVGSRQNNLGATYNDRATRAEAANDLNRCLRNLELTLPHLREAARIFRANNHMDRADTALRNIVKIEENIRQVRTAIATAGAAASPSVSTTTRG